MELEYIAKMNPNLPDSFANDGYKWNEEMERKYFESEFSTRPGKILVRPKLKPGLKNVALFDLTGVEIWHGDLEPKNVAKLKGVYYLFSAKRLSGISTERITTKKFEDYGIYKSPLIEYLNLKCPVVIKDIEYMKENAFARIVDGEIQTSERLISKKFQ